MPILNIHDKEIKLEAQKLGSIQQSLQNIGVRDNRETQIKILIDCIKKLCASVIHLRNTLLSLLLSPKKEQEIIDDTISEVIKVEFDHTYYHDFFTYEVTVPFIIPKAKSLISKSLWNASFKSAYRKYHKETELEIYRIDKPIVIFENRFINENQGNGLKDTDNYEVSDILNMLQYYFIADDSTATIAIRNITGAKTNETKIHIVPEENFKDWLLNSY